MASWYVSTTGNNANAGTDEAAPFLTIPTAIAAASNGDTVYVMDGIHVYTTTINITSNCYKYS